MPFDAHEAEELAKKVSVEFKEHYEKLNKKTEDQAQVIDEIKKKSAAKEDVSDLTNRLTGLTDEVKKLSELADDIDKKLTRRGGGDESHKSNGARIVESDDFKAMVKKGGGTISFELNTKATLLTSSINIPVPAQGWGLSPQMIDMVTVPRQPLSMRDLIPSSPTSSNSIAWYKWTRAAMSAATVAEGALKPESNITVPTLQNSPVQTIAHIIYQSKQLMDDSPAFQSILDQEMRRGVLETENQQLLLGDGVAPNLSGFLPQATLMAQSAANASNGIPVPVGGVSAITAVDLIRWGKLRAAKRFYPADAVVMNPEDWAKIEMLKDTQGAYLFSAFTSGTEPRLWGLRVRESFDVPVGRFLVGSFGTGARIWDRETLNVMISTENKDNFEKNMVTIRAEERIALTVQVPDAFAYGFTTAVA
jgi:HK97 family phage major capsid protein